MMLANILCCQIYRNFKAKRVAFSYECQRCDYDDFQNFICKVLILVDTILTLPQYFSMANKHFNESRYSQTDTAVWLLDSSIQCLKLQTYMNVAPDHDSFQYK